MLYRFQRGCTGFKQASNPYRTSFNSFKVPLMPLKCRFQIPKINSSQKKENTRSGFSIQSKVYERALASSIYLTTIFFIFLKRKKEPKVKICLHTNERSEVCMKANVFLLHNIPLVFLIPQVFVSLPYSLP